MIISAIVFQLHNRCTSHVTPECNLGINSIHLLPPICICPTVLDRQHSVSKEKHSQKGSSAKVTRSNSSANNENFAMVRSKIITTNLFCDQRNPSENICRECSYVNKLTRVNFLWLVSGCVSHLWFGLEFGKFPLKMSNFSIFSIRVKKLLRVVS